MHFSAQVRTAVKPAVANFVADFIHQEFSWQSCFVIFRFLAIKASQFCINCFFFVFYVVLCLLFFLTFWGTLPCGSHLLNYVSPKRRKCKAICVVVCQISWKNLNVKLVKEKKFSVEGWLRDNECRLCMKIISDDKIEKKSSFALARFRMSSYHNC